MKQPVPAEWLKIAANIVIPFDETLQIHPEFDGYNGQTIKQADVVLLGFPLMYPMSDTVRYNDLLYYRYHSRLVSRLMIPALVQTQQDQL